MDYIITKIVNRNRAVNRFIGLFGNDFAQNAKRKR